MLPEITLRGTPYARGFQHGTAFAGQIRRFLSDDTARIGSWLDHGASSKEFRSSLRTHRTNLERYAPLLEMELLGLAAGADIGIDDAVLLQFRRELAGPGRDFQDCSLAAWSGIHPILAQTIDLDGGMDELACIQRHEAGEGNRAKILFGFAGLLGYLGMNDVGLCVGINMVNASDWVAGLSPYLLVRLMLECGSVPEAREVLASIPRGSSRCFTLLQGGHLESVELTGTRMHATESETVFHTNHYLHPEFVAGDRASAITLLCSKARLATLRKASFEGAPSDPNGAFGILSGGKGIGRLQLPEPAEPFGHRTVASVVMFPLDGTLHARRNPADPATGGAFRLREVG